MSENRGALIRSLLQAGSADVPSVTRWSVDAVVYDTSRPAPIVVRRWRGVWRCDCTQRRALRDCAHVDAVQLVAMRRLRDYRVTTPPTTSG